DLFVAVVLAAGLAAALAAGFTGAAFFAAGLLAAGLLRVILGAVIFTLPALRRAWVFSKSDTTFSSAARDFVSRVRLASTALAATAVSRSEERRVGKGCGFRWRPEQGREGTREQPRLGG